jgi:F-type H+-transporting ATPase subunit a
MMNLFTLASDPLDHVVNHKAIMTPDGWWVWSGNQGVLALTGLVMVVVGMWAAGKIRTGPKGEGAEAYVTKNRFAHMIEVIATYLREEVARPLLHDRTEKLMPFLWTVFFFILVNNILGLVPIRDGTHLVQGLLGGHAEGGEHASHPAEWIGGTATQNLFVTGALAVVAALVFNIAAIVRLGPVGFVKHMLGGLPLYMAPIALLLLIIEAAGQFLIKPFALALRLFANMTAGHVLIATLLIFAGEAIAKFSQSPGSNLTVMLLTAGGALLLTFLELFVAVLQAFVFMFLTTVFISLMDHHDEHGHEHEHGHSHGHEHAHA